MKKIQRPMRPYLAVRLPNYKYYDLTSIQSTHISSKLIPTQRQKATSAIGRDLLTSEQNNLNGIPQEPGSEDCCMSGCAICVWDIYNDELQDYNSKHEVKIEVDPMMQVFRDFERAKHKPK